MHAYTDTVYAFGLTHTHSQRSVLDTVPGHLQKMPQTAKQNNNSQKRIIILMIMTTTKMMIDEENKNSRMFGVFDWSNDNTGSSLLEMK